MFKLLFLSLLIAPALALADDSISSAIAAAQQKTADALKPPAVVEAQAIHTHKEPQFHLVSIRVHGNQHEIQIEDDAGRRFIATNARPELRDGWRVASMLDFTVELEKTVGKKTHRQTLSWQDDTLTNSPVQQSNPINPMGQNFMVPGISPMPNQGMQAVMPPMPQGVPHPSD